MKSAAQTQELEWLRRVVDSDSARLSALRAENGRLRRALDFIVTDGTITPEGCPEPWRSTLIEWAQAANHALHGETT